MKKILSEEEKNKRAKRNGMVVGIILIGIMIISSAGYAFYNTNKTNTENKNEVEYNGFKFNLQEDGLWHVKLGNNELVTQFNAKEVENISTPSISLQQYTNKPLYFVSENNLAVNEIAKNLNNFVARVQYACLEKECKDNLPVKNCTQNLIIIEDSNKTEVKKQDNCVFISAPYSESNRASDAFIFQIFGVK